MKRFLLSLVMIFTVTCAFSQIFTYRSTAFAYKTNSGYGWSDWSSWQSSSVKITINFNTDIITIYSPTTQRLKAVAGPNEYVDASGGSNAAFRCYDMVDNCYCELRLRQESNGNSQMYLTYSNIMYVYNVRRI